MKLVFFFSHWLNLKYEFDSDFTYVDFLWCANFLRCGFNEDTMRDDLDWFVVGWFGLVWFSLVVVVLVTLGFFIIWLRCSWQIRFENGYKFIAMAIISPKKSCFIRFKWTPSIILVFFFLYLSFGKAMVLGGERERNKGISTIGHVWQVNVFHIWVDCCVWNYRKFGSVFGFSAFAHCHVDSRKKNWKWNWWLFNKNKLKNRAPTTKLSESRNEKPFYFF